jgi:L,D-peptidoglycan transpeptidase YkuD (ErfK/YbiS/YcfS/YnhG family)
MEDDGSEYGSIMSRMDLMQKKQAGWWDRGSVGTAVIGTTSWADASCHDN